MANKLPLVTFKYQVSSPKNSQSADPITSQIKTANISYVGSKKSLKMFIFGPKTAYGRLIFYQWRQEIESSCKNN